MDVAVNLCSEAQSANKIILDRSEYKGILGIG